MIRCLGLVILVTTLLTSCTVNKPVAVTPENRREILRQEMLKWENFSAEGVANLNYMGLTLRKMFVLSKTRDEIRFDVIDGGIMGAGASPLISVYLGEYLSLRSDVFPQLSLLAKAMIDPRVSTNPFKDINTLVDAYADSILSSGKLVRDGIELSFSPQLRLERVYDPKSKSEALISYTPKGQPDKLVIKMDNAGAELLFDHVDYGQASLEPLPRQETSILEQFPEPEYPDEIAPPEEEKQ